MSGIQIASEVERCPLGLHAWHGLPKPTCPGVLGLKPRVAIDPHPCARCSTGFPVEHTCTPGRTSVGPTTTTAPRKAAS